MNHQAELNKDDDVGEKTKNILTWHDICYIQEQVKNAELRRRVLVIDKKIERSSEL